MTVDTTTTAGKIAVMQAYLDGQEVHVRIKGSSEWHRVYPAGNAASEPEWDWPGNEYRLKPLEPREFFVSVYPEDDGKPDEAWGYVHGTAESASRGSMPRKDIKIIKVREVIE